MKKAVSFFAGCLWLFVVTFEVWGQGRTWTGPEDPPGDPGAARVGWMNGNRFLLKFRNNTQIAEWPPTYDNKWPNDYTGGRLIDVASPLVGSEIYIYQDSIPIDRLDDPRLLEAGAIDTILFVQAHSYQSNNPDMNYDRTVEWSFHAVPGYFDETQDYMAMSNKPDSWPREGWPFEGFTKIWQGEWNGRFGRGIAKAALESYFVANDAQDLEAIIQRNDPEEKLITLGPRYLPRPGRMIGDLHPNITTQRGLPWGGLGIRIEARGYQWSNSEAQDIVFWEYNISNISDYDLPVSGFGFWVDNAIGGDASAEQEAGYRDKILDLAYVWERSGIGEAGNPPGVMGYAYLETPGMVDGTDNDDDGVIDERRDNQATMMVGPTDGIANLQKFLAFFKLTEADLKPHWLEDEDQDWQDGFDPDNDGSYADQDQQGNWVLEPGAFVGDDVGIDGVGPGDLNYNGPDVDGTECNHRPDFQEFKGEPNFGPLDIGESDMVGLTSFLMFDWQEWQNTLRLTLNEDENVWNRMNSNVLSEYLSAGSVGSLYMIFASSPFPFHKYRTERISMGFMATYENLAGLNSSRHDAPNMFRLKEVSETIYGNDYQFAQPPLLPTLRATPGDGQVILTWDDFSDTKTREPLLNNTNDFEGYKLYKSTDKYMSDPVVITDGKGYKKFRTPIFQCDKIDTIRGYASFGGAMDGRLVYLGDDTGIRHYFIDTEVQNGRTYYYALVAYDYGIADLKISPAENLVDIELDEAENVVRMGKNIQVVTPRQSAAGYLPPEIVVDPERSSARLTGGRVIPTIVSAGDLRVNHTYKLTFKSNVYSYFIASKARRSIRDGRPVTSGLEVHDITQAPARVYFEDGSAYSENNLQYDTNLKTWMLSPDADIYTDVFEGLQCKISVPPTSSGLDRANSGWVQGQAPINVTLGPAMPFFPYQYEIVFDPSQEYQSLTTRGSGIYDADSVLIPTSKRVLGMKYPFYVINKMFTDSLGNYERLDFVLLDENENGVLDWDTDKIQVGYPVTLAGVSGYYWGGTIFAFDFIQTGSNANPTATGEVYRISLQRPLTEWDSFVFTVKPENALEATKVKTSMEAIKVVPNPYVATNLMETAVDNKFLNQRRRLLFTHIPANCVIRIFTPSGTLVDRIEVDNEPANGTVHWDLLSREGLEIAAGMYVYHVKSNVTGDEKVGKFAVIK